MKSLVIVAAGLALAISLSACAGDLTLPPPSPGAAAAPVSYAAIETEDRSPDVTANPSLFPDFYFAAPEYQKLFRDRMLGVPGNALKAAGGENRLRFVLRQSVIGFDNIPSDAFIGVPFLNILTGMSSLSTERPFQARVAGTLEVIDGAGDVLRYRDIEIVSEVEGKSGELEVSLGRLADKASADLAAEIRHALERYF